MWGTYGFTVSWRFGGKFYKWIFFTVWKQSLFLIVCILTTCGDFSESIAHGIAWEKARLCKACYLEDDHFNVFLKCSVLTEPKVMPHYRVVKWTNLEATWFLNRPRKVTGLWYVCTWILDHTCTSQDDDMHKHIFVNLGEFYHHNDSFGFR